MVGLIRERNIPCVRGNHEEFVHDNQKWLRENTIPGHPEAKKRLLTEETLNYLRSLPFALRYTWEGLRVLVVHGTPSSNMVYLYPKSAPEKFESAARETAADVIIYGHTHQPLRAEFAGVKFFNPGSVRQSEFRGLGSHTCATLTLPDCTFRVFDIRTGEQVDVPTLPAG